MEEESGLTEIPVEFDYEGTFYRGMLREVLGAGSAAGTRWDLSINRYHFGRVIYTENKGFRFVSNQWEDDSLNDVFEFYILSWYQ